MDALVGDYLEFLWGEGEGRAKASNCLAALQDFDPKLRGLVSWRLMKAWTTNEVTNRAPPLTEAVLKAMAGWSFFNEHPTFGLSLLLAFYGLLRTGELLSLQSWQIHMTSPNKPAVVSLGLTKSGKGVGRKLPPNTHTSSPNPMFGDNFLNFLMNVSMVSKIQEWGFRPYSLGRGGATSYFVKVGSLDRVLLLGCWTAIKIAKIYLNSGLAMLADIKNPTSTTSSVSLCFSQISTVPPNA